MSYPNCNDDGRRIEDSLATTANSAHAWPKLLRAQNPAVQLDHTKHEIAAGWVFDISAEAVMEAGQDHR